jgi:DNA-binding LacI/PurR family transcriptional regulator
MQDLGYQPNSLARALATKRTRIIALFYPSWRSGIGPQSEFITSIAETASDHGYALLLWTSPISEEREVTKMTHQGFIDGAILMEVALHDPRVEMLKKRHLPFTMIGRCAENDDTSFVDTDFDDALATSICYLAEAGHRHIALINQSEALLKRETGYVVRSRAAFLREIQHYGLHGHDMCSEANEQAGYETTMTLLEQDPLISAFVLLTPWTSGGIMRALSNKGLSIPGDVSLVAIFSPHLAQLTTPALTSIDVPFYEMGQLGAEMLINQLESIETTPSHLLLKPPLTVRASSGPYLERLR